MINDMAYFIENNMWQGLRAPDHKLKLIGVVEGLTVWDVECIHTDTDKQWYLDTDGHEFDECHIQGWFSECGSERVTASNGDTGSYTPIPLWTHWNLDDSQQLMGRRQAAEFLHVTGDQP